MARLDRRRRTTRELLGEIDWAAHPAVGPLILDAEALTGAAEGSLQAAGRRGGGSCPAGPGHD